MNMETLAPEFFSRICSMCDQIINPTDDGKWVDEDNMRMCMSSGTPARPHAPNSLDKEYHSYKFGSELARVLWLMSLDSSQDADTSYKGMWFARFDNASSILVSDDQGHVYAETYAEGFAYPFKDVQDAWDIVEADADEWYEENGDY